MYTNLIDKSTIPQITYSLSKCRKCGHIYFTPKPDRKEVIKLYNNYWPHTIRNNFLEKVEIFMTKEYRIILSIPPSKLLDVGCGSGKFIKSLKSRGWLVFGVDINPIAIRNAKRRGLKKVFCGELPKISFPEKYFDVVLLRHVIEHLHDLDAYLRRINEILKDNGLLIISTPNVESDEYKIFRRYWYQLDFPRHLNLFNPMTIRKLLSRYEFVVESIYTDYRPFFSFSKSLLNVFCHKHSIFRLFDNILIHMIMFLPFFKIHLNTSIIALARART